ncbi:TPA: type IV secretion system protein [Escherichia coli]|nr:type IV secretion system protein [Escherichia coli]
MAQYIRHREGYLWDTRNYDREMVGLLSAPAIQQQYAEYTDPRKNPQAPIVVYGQNSEVETKVKAISMLNAGEELEGETRYTAMVRYTKQVRRAGEFSPLTHWAATITFAYRNEPMKLDDRTKNPLGFQVISYRNDQETGGL